MPERHELFEVDIVRKADDYDANDRRSRSNQTEIKWPAVQWHNDTGKELTIEFINGTPLEDHADNIVIGPGPSREYRIRPDAGRSAPYKYKLGRRTTAPPPGIIVPPPPPGDG